MVKAALKKTNGRIALAAAKLNMSRQALHDRVNRNPELRTFLSDLDELIIDTAENVIFTAVRNGSDANARFLLLQKGRSRGYGRLEREDAPPPDPDAEARRANAMKIIGSMIEERARLGLPALFAKEPEPKIVEITDSRPARRVGENGTSVPTRR
jgi:hypothetical protein